MGVAAFSGAGSLGADGGKQLLRELEAGRQLRHDNLIQLFGFVKLPTGPALVLELAAGPVPGGLRGVLSDRNACPLLPWARRVRWLAGIAAGMKELHRLLPQPIIHRDLKAANVLLSSTDLSIAVPKVADFGIAITMDTMRSTLTGGGGMAGTLAWKAPETFRGRYHEASDVFSFGVLAFEMASRAVPWAGIGQPELLAKANAWFDPAAKAVLRQVKRGVSIEEQQEEWAEDNPLQERRPDLTTVEAGCPQELLVLLQRCWADDPAERPNFEQCVEELGQIQPRRETFADSHFKREYDSAGFEDVTMATEVFAAVARFVRHYCAANGLTSDADSALKLSFLRELQRETGGNAAVDAFGEAGPTATLLWTSAKKFGGAPELHWKELCSLINAALRDDKPELAAVTAGVARAIKTTLCVVRNTPLVGLRFPAGGRTYRGGKFSDALRPFFEVGKSYRVPGFLATSFSKAWRGTLPST